MNFIAYVVGFLFHNETGDVALIHKNHPGWQAGKLNGVGGKIKSGELSIVAMRREFKEEAGIDIEDWEPFATLDGSTYTVYVFRAFCDTETAQQLRSCTDEKVEWFPSTHMCENKDVVSNLKWLIPLAKAPHKFDVIYTDHEGF